MSLKRQQQRFLPKEALQTKLRAKQAKLWQGRDIGLFVTYQLRHVRRSNPGFHMIESPEIGPFLSIVLGPKILHGGSG